VCEKSISEAGLANNGVKVLAVHRDLKTIANPDEGFKLKVDDVVVLMGPEKKLSVLGNIFQEPRENGAQRTS